MAGPGKSSSSALPGIFKRVMTDNYVIFRDEDFKAMAQQYRFAARFNGQFEIEKAEALDKVKTRQLYKVSAKSAQTGISEALDSIDQFNAGEIVSEFLEIIVSKLSGQFQQAVDKFLTLEETAFAQAEVYANGSADQTKLNILYDAIGKAAQLISQGAYRQLVNYLGGGTNTSTGGKVVKISAEDIKIADEIVKILDKAKQDAAMGPITVKSMKGRIGDIFAGPIGENLAGKLVANALNNDTFRGAVEEAFKTEIQTPLAGYGVNIKLDFKNAKYIQSGTDKTITTDKTSKSDIIIPDAFHLYYELNGKVVDIVIDSNLSVKWGQKKNTTISTIKLVESTMNAVLTSLDRSLEGIIRNVISHRVKNPEYYTQVRTFMVAHFINQWASGTGETLRKTGETDMAQFLFVNGELISTTQLLTQALKDMQSNSLGTKNITLSFQGIGQINADDKKWWEPQGVSDTDNWAPAYRRSARINEAINGIKVFARAGKNLLP